MQVVTVCLCPRVHCGSSNDTGKTTIEIYELYYPKTTIKIKAIHQCLVHVGKCH